MDCILHLPTPEEILHMLKDKYNINIYLQINIQMILVEKIIIKSRNILKIYMKNMNILFNDNLPTDLHTAFQIIKLSNE